MNAEELIETKRNRIEDHWHKMEFINESFEDHPDRDWLDKHCVIKNISDEIPAKIETIEEREGRCIELFRDFETSQLTPEGDKIAVGEVWEFVEWEDKNNTEMVSGAHDGFQNCMEYAIEYAKKQELPVVQYTSITSFDNLRYRSLKLDS